MLLIRCLDELDLVSSGMNQAFCRCSLYTEQCWYFAVHELCMERVSESQHRHTSHWCFVGLYKSHLLTWVLRLFMCHNKKKKGGGVVRQQLPFCVYACKYNLSQHRCCLCCRVSCLIFMNISAPWCSPAWCVQMNYVTDRNSVRNSHFALASQAFSLVLMCAYSNWLRLKLKRMWLLIRWVLPVLAGFALFSQTSSWSLIIIFISGRKLFYLKISILPYSSLLVHTGHTYIPRDGKHTHLYYYCYLGLRLWTTQEGTI